MSPELIKGEPLNEKTDIYSLGMVLIEMITLDIPYCEFNHNLNLMTQKIKEGVKPASLERISDEKEKKFILKLMDKDPNKRPSVSELLNDEFLKINDKEDNRYIKLIKIKRKKKKIIKKNEIQAQPTHYDDVDFSHKKYNDSIDKKLIVKNLDKKKKILFKQEFEEHPYFDENINIRSMKHVENKTSEKMKRNRESNGFDLVKLLDSPSKNVIVPENLKSDNNKKESTMTLQHIVTSSQCEGAFTQYSKYYSDVYQTNTDYMYTHHHNKNKIPTNNLNVHTDNKQKTNTDDSFDKKEEKNMIQKNIEKLQELSKIQEKISVVKDTNSPLEKPHTPIDKKDTLKDEKKEIDQKNPIIIENIEPISHDNLENTGLVSNHHYKIFDNNYNVHLKFLINQDGKLHEIQFTYNLLRDNIPDLMEEIQNEFNFSYDHLNHIYETLKKISIYSKFYKNSDLLHDNSF